MAETKRLTAAEKRALAEAQRAEATRLEWAEFTAQYPVRFANVLFKYMEMNYTQFNVHKLDDETYQFTRKYTDETLKVTLPANYDWEVVSALERVEQELHDYEEERAEEARKENVRRNALAKLTAEERELLDL